MANNVLNPITGPVSDITTINGDDHTNFDTALGYLKSICELPKFYRNILNRDTATLNAEIPWDLQQAEPVRDLQFGGSITDLETDFKKDKWMYNLHALFCQVTGRVVATNCTKCKKKKVFPICVRFDPANGGDAVERESCIRTCSNCMYNGSGTHCSFY